ncbi:MAG: hypothetical protein M3409_08310 [Gemmatimonadota bacterium]|nr:hypothetical protein [Gemmatimonadota bacterium]
MTTPIFLVKAGALPALLLLQTGLRPDTVVTIQATPQGWALWVDTLTSIASVVIALALIVGGLAAIPIARQALRTFRNVNQLFAQVRGDLAPLIRHGHAVAENADYVSTAIRADVQRLSETIAGATQRLETGAAATETRIREFNALLQVVQREAEELFIDTASTVRGARAGAETFRAFRAEPPPHRESSDP